MKVERDLEGSRAHCDLTILSVVPGSAGALPRATRAGGPALAGGEMIHKETPRGSLCQISGILRTTRFTTPSSPPLPLVPEVGVGGDV